jgi:multimeric flavodoxin WrbA
MKILTLIGSYRKHGNTARAAAMILEEMERLAAEQGSSVENETLFLGELDLDACRGCRVCFDRGEEKCPLKDDAMDVRAKMLAADGLIVATPIYVDDVSGITKTWIDRMAHLCHRPALVRQSALLVTTVGGTPSSHTMRTLNTALLTWGAHIAGQVGFKMGALMPEEDLPALRPQARRAAGQLFNSVLRRDHERPSFFSLMMFRIQQIGWRRAKAGSVDHRHWSENGWLDAQREFYIPHRAPWLKTALARRVGDLVARVVI